MTGPAARPATGAAPTITVFDLDGTITRSDTYVAFLLRFLQHRPSRVLRASWLPLAVGMHSVGARDNTWLKATFLRSIAGGESREAVEAVAIELVDELLARGLRPGAVATIDEHRLRGDRLLLATASLDIYVEPLARALGFSEVVCTRVEWDERGRLSGRLAGDNCYGERKLAAVAAHVGDRTDVRLEAYSDHISDLPLLEWSHRAAVVNPDSRLKAHASAKGFEILHW